MYSLIDKCRKLEESPFLYDRVGNKILTNIGFFITSDYSDVVELSSKNLKRDFLLPYNLNDCNTIVIGCNHNNEKNINLIVTNSYLLVFWDMMNENIIKKSNNIECTIISTLQQFEKTKIENDMCIVLTSDMLKKLWDTHTFFRELRYNRLILHNLENFNILNKYNISFGFKWIITSHKSLLENTLKSDHLCINENITIESEEQSSRIKTNDIFCKRPIASITLDGLVEKTIIDGIESYDIKKIIKHLSSPIIKTEADVLKHVLRRFNDNLRVAEENEICIERMEYANKEDKQQRLDDIQKLKKTLNDKKQELIKRISNNNLCFICYDEIEVKCILKCCTNVVCFSCINKWLQRSDKCPLCKMHKFKHLIVEEDSTNEKYMTKSNALISSENCIFQNFTLLIKQLLSRKATSKIMIIGKDDVMISRFCKLLQNSNINYLEFKGNKFLLKNILKKFSHDNYNVMFINHSNISCGIPLNNVTDIVLLSKNININGVLSQCKNIKEIWTLMYTIT